MCRKVLTFEQFDDQVRRAGMHGDFEDLDDVRVSDGGRRAALSDEARRSDCSPREVLVEHFDRDVLTQRRVPRLIDGCHSARAERSYDLVRADTSARLMALVQGHGTGERLRTGAG